MNIPVSRTLWFTAGLFAAGVHAACADEFPVIGWQGRTMGGPYTVKIVGTNLPQARLNALRAQVEERLAEVNRQMSHYQPDSELSQFNRAPANTPFKISPGFASVTRFCLELNQLSGGAFDPTLGPVINLWGFGEKTEQRTVPAEADLRAALAKTGCQHLTVTVANELVKDIADLALNLSSAAKGFGTDEIVRVLRGHGLTNIYVAIAGEVVALGHNPRGTKWQVGISAPIPHWKENDPMAAVLSLSGQGVSTSGDYQKFFSDAQGRRFGHIFDPRTGWPVQHNLASVSVVGPDSMTASALATTLFVLGVDRGMEFVEGSPNTAALFIVRDGEDRFRQVPSSRFKALTGYAP